MADLGRCGAAPPPLRALAVPAPLGAFLTCAASDRLVVAFASVGHDPDRPPSAEFARTVAALGCNGLFICDASRSWANDAAFAPALHQALAAARAAAPPIRQLLLVGQSMGAFCALAAAGLLAGTGQPPMAVLAFGPQYSVHPDHAPPGEDRWRDWTCRITRFRHPVAPLPQGPAITLFHGLIDDRAQALAFPLAPGVDQLLYPGLDHSGLCRHLRARGLLAGLFDAALSGDRRRLLRLAIAAGGQRRKASRP